MYQITKLKVNLCYADRMSLNAASLQELKWWCHNLNLNKERPIKIKNAEVRIQSDAVKSGGWGGTLPGTDSRASVKQGGKTAPQKCLRNESSQIDDRVVLQGEKTKISSPTNRQRHSPAPLGENGRKFRGKFGST